MLELKKLEGVFEMMEQARMTLLQGLEGETAQDFIDRIVREERKRSKMTLFGSK